MKWLAMELEAQLRELTISATFSGPPPARAGGGERKSPLASMIDKPARTPPRRNKVGTIDHLAQARFGAGCRASQRDHYSSYPWNEARYRRWHHWTGSL